MRLLIDDTMQASAGASIRMARPIGGTVRITHKHIVYGVQPKF